MPLWLMWIVGFCAWCLGMGLIALCHRPKTSESEPDPLKELEAAHRIELAEWDEQFHRLTDKWVDPPQNTYFYPGLRADFGAGAAHYAMRQQAFEKMAQQQSQLNLQQAQMAFEQNMAQLQGAQSGQLSQQTPPTLIQGNGHGLAGSLLHLLGGGLH